MGFGVSMQKICIVMKKHDFGFIFVLFSFLFIGVVRVGAVGVSHVAPDDSLLLVEHCDDVADVNRVFQGYSGGMMVHAGYLFGKNPSAVLPTGEDVSPQGVTNGIGGSLRVNLWKYLRVGCEGFVSTMRSNFTDMDGVLQSGSYVQSGWGGVIADACWRMEKVWPYVGASVGGGSMRTLSVVEGSEADWIPEDVAMLTKQSFGYVDPYVGVDWCMTQRVHLTVRLDWMLAISHGQLLKPTGPRLFIGFMFCH